MSKQRNSNIEMLRVVLMTLIVIWHYIMHGLDMKSPALYQDEQWNNTLAIFSASFMSFPVDCFIFISGYFGITLKKSKVIRFVIMIFTYSLITLMIGYMVGFNTGLFTNIQAFFPICNNRWWFFTAYFYLMLLSPFINCGIKMLDKETYKILLVIMFLSFYGVIQWLFGTRFFDLQLFIFIYLLGRYIRLYPISIFNRHPYYLLLLCSVVILALTMLSVSTKSGFLLYRLWYYHNPLVLVLAISVFFIFYNSNFKSQYVRNFSGGALATYLLTDSMYTQNWYNRLIVDNFHWSIWPIVAVLTIVFCALFENIRLKVTNASLRKMKYIYANNVGKHKKNSDESYI